MSRRGALPATVDQMSTDDERDQLHRDGRCDVVVEIPRGSRNKYEASEEGEIWFDRRLGGPAGFPGDYGYVIGSEGEDGDALDALVLLEEATFPGVHMRCRVIGAFALQVGDIAETKLIVVPETDHHADHLHDLGDLPPTLVLCGTRDLLVPACRRLAARAAEAGWDLTYVEEPGAIHVYPLLPGIPEAARAWTTTLEFLR